MVDRRHLTAGMAWTWFLLLAVADLASSGGPPQQVPPKATFGVLAADVTDGLAGEAGLERTAGAMVTGLVRGGPAERAGLQVGDIIVSADKLPLAAVGDLFVIQAMRRPGDRVALALVRRRQHVDATVVLDPQGPNDPGLVGEANRRWCAALECPPCLADLASLARPSSDGCRACLAQSAADVAGCVSGLAGPGGGPETPPAPAAQPVRPGQPGTPPSQAPPVPPAPAAPAPVRQVPEPPAALTLRALSVVPSPVPAGAAFEIDVAYAAPSSDALTFTFSITLNGREIFASRPENIDPGSGTAMRYRRLMKAASEPGAYRLRVRLSQGADAVEREVPLTVTS
jgi:hypothetical protein